MQLNFSVLIGTDVSNMAQAAGKSTATFTPFQVKGFASGVVACVASGVIFVVVKAFPAMVVNLGTHGTYFVFAGICLAMFLFSLFFIPETGGKSAAQLERLFEDAVGNNVGNVVNGCNNNCNNRKGSGNNNEDQLMTPLKELVP